jgi:gamma-glutamyl-gamma-aminobutyrate hydrolase PuuD
VPRILTVPTGNPAPYDAALRAAGLEPVYGNSLDGVEGLMLQGGTDVNPARYGEVPHPETDEPDDARDALELKLIAEALDRDLPILAICRGMQILNVAHGGTLIQHTEGHQVRSEDKSLPVHSIDITRGTHLAAIAGLNCEVNSRHHQAVGKVGAELVVSARDPRDGIIEAIERPDKRFVVGVQWHPEDERRPELFQAFASAISSSGSTSTSTSTSCSAPPSNTP